MPGLTLPGDLPCLSLLKCSLTLTSQLETCPIRLHSLRPSLPQNADRQRLATPSTCHYALPPTGMPAANVFFYNDMQPQDCLLLPSPLLSLPLLGIRPPLVQWQCSSSLSSVAMLIRRR